MTVVTEITGRLVLPGGIVPGRLSVAEGAILALSPDPTVRGPYVAPGFIDLHVHGWGGHDAMAGVDAIRRMARALVLRGVTGFLPTAVAAPIGALSRFGAEVRAVAAEAGRSAAVPLGFNLEGPFLAPSRRGAHAAAHLRSPADVAPDGLDAAIDGLRMITVAPELAGAVGLIERLSASGVVVALGHSEATLADARAGFAAGARATTHLFNAMSGLDHRAPGLAAAALADDSVAVELIADGHHVHPALWPIVMRTKPPGRVILVSDAVAPAGTGARHADLGGVEIELRDGRSVLAGTDTLAGSLIALDDAVRNVVAAGIGLVEAVAAASRNPALLLGLVDRGEIAVGRRADLVELDDDLRVTGVVLGGARV